MTELRQEFDMLAHVDALYQPVVRTPEVPDSAALPMQLLIFCHYHLYQSFSTLFRCHLSDAFSSVRVAVEAALHAFRILEGHGTAEQYINRDKTFLHSVNNVRRFLDANPGASPVASHLIKIHEACSQYASHADFDSFVHRLELVKHKRPMIKVHYFQKPQKTSEFQFYAMTLLHTFSVILSLFESFLRHQKIVDEAWSKRLREVGETIEKWRSQLQEPDLGAG